jgi:hypothetical protein
MFSEARAKEMCNVNECLDKFLTPERPMALETREALKIMKRASFLLKENSRCSGLQMKRTVDFLEDLVTRKKEKLTEETVSG